VTLCSSDEESKGSRIMTTLECDFSVAMFAGWRAGTIFDGRRRRLVDRCEKTLGLAIYDLRVTGLIFNVLAN
jgi:hypothetical protein